MFRNIIFGFLAASLAFAASAQDTAFAPRGVQIPTPDCTNLYNAWDNVLHGACLDPLELPGHPLLDPVSSKAL